MITILGGKGFIGSHLATYFEKQNIEYWIPEKNDSSIFNKPLGNVIYCIGMTADFRSKTFETVEAHVCYLSKVLKESNYESFIYLSSTRIYKCLSTNNTANEDMNLSVNPNNEDEIYNISKLMGESLCLAQKNKNVKIVRLSNVFGDDFKSENFLTSIIKDIIKEKKLELNTTLSSSKDYIYIDDVVKLIIKILFYGKKRVYNVASGINYSNEFIINEIKKHVDFICKVNNNAYEIIFPRISIDNIKYEFDFEPIKIDEKIAEIISMFRVFLDLGN